MSPRHASWGSIVCNLRANHGSMKLARWNGRRFDAILWVRKVIHARNNWRVDPCEWETKKKKKKKTGKKKIEKERVQNYVEQRLDEKLSRRGSAWKIQIARTAQFVSTLLRRGALSFHDSGGASLTWSIMPDSMSRGGWGGKAARGENLRRGQRRDNANEMNEYADECVQ